MTACDIASMTALLARTFTRAAAEKAALETTAPGKSAEPPRRPSDDATHGDRQCDLRA